ncbi:hypothetical protein SAMN05192550_0661 [Flavobacterium glycines]|uniref:LTXXQ motif family protein n=1 Tax=Flavobacterium glycines TaxID=551990 RepID=A0A1B9DNN2_9FLAO|nr:hypothetical protein [Flavobacterium glycines]OCB71297.1 hypothetical protein FBGL_08590 [Flavobacterium glycines]GEL10307.1 hypothetical protein FGL01_10460 [Flavobacterium glycines]SDI72911.1 hypothetical protein SAMN05192550_0661 [Flavobacterium glycines]
MKSIITITVFLFFMGLHSGRAQKSTVVDNFTTEQQKLVQQQRDLIKANREAFKASLTAEQLAILKDASLSKEQKQAALVLTFTTAQKNLLNESKENIKDLRRDFKNSLTTEQRQQIQEHNSNRIRETIKDSRLRDVKHR